MPDARAASLAQLQQQDRARNSVPALQLQARAGIMASRPGLSPVQRMEEEELVQGKFSPAQRVEDEELLQGKLAPAQRIEDEEVAQAKQAPVQAMAGGPAQRESRPNHTGLPDQLKAGIESLSGMSMDHVRVNYNSDRPAQLQAHAYAQGSQIHLAPGQEQHLPHEAWHVVQQAQGRVRPTLQMMGSVPVNDDRALEDEADSMGARALGVGQLAAQEDGALPGPGSSGAHNAAVAQRQITIEHIDYNPKTHIYRDGYINEPGFYLDVLEGIKNDDKLGQLYVNHWKNVQAALPQDFTAPDIDAMTGAVSAAIIGQYGGKNRPLIQGSRVTALEAIVRRALINRIEADYQVNMTAEEGNAYDQLAATPGATASRAKSVPNSVQYGSLPGAVKGEVDGRLAELRNERALWTATVAALTPDLTLPNGGFGADVCTRQGGFHYQGNHTNLAGWLPDEGAPPNHVEQTAQAIHNAASNGLQTRLTSANAMQKLGYHHPAGANHNPYRTEYETLRAVQVPAIGDANVKMSAMSALCQGVSAYIEFSMASEISRFMFDPVNNRAFVTAHYKWRQGKNPFFEVLGFPAV